jgi:sulfite reductase alpha subunit-like flavoprotein
MAHGAKNYFGWFGGYGPKGTGAWLESIGVYLAWLWTLGFLKRLFDLEREEEQATPKLHLAIVYYSSTGTNYQLAQWAAEAGKEAGAEVKIFKVSELAPESVIASPAWKAHVEATEGSGSYAG